MLMNLNFEKVVKDAFSFLEKDYGFSCIESEPWSVCYSSSNVLVWILFDYKNSYELNCSIAHLDNVAGSKEVPFDLGEVIRSSNIKSKLIASSFQVIKEENLIKFTHQLASLLKQYASLLLMGNKDEFIKVAILRNRESAEYAQKQKLEQARKKSEKAWKERDFNAVVEALLPLEKNLSSIDFKKLEYAKKHITW